MSVAGKVFSYNHHDQIACYKGSALVRVLCDSEAGSRTDAFWHFGDALVKLVYGASASTPHPTWDDVTALFPDIDLRRTELAATLGETITIAEIVVLRLDQEVARAPTRPADPPAAPAPLVALHPGAADPADGRPGARRRRNARQQPRGTGDLPGG